MNTDINSTFKSPDYVIDSRLYWSDMNIDLDNLISLNNRTTDLNKKKEIQKLIDENIEYYNTGIYGAWFINKMVNRILAIQQALKEKGGVTKSNNGTLQDDVYIVDPATSKLVPDISVAPKTTYDNIRYFNGTEYVDGAIWIG